MNLAEFEGRKGKKDSTVGLKPREAAQSEGGK